MGWLRKKGRELFAIDPRSLAFFRIGLGVMLFSDLVKRSLTLREHYTAAGVFPREAALQIQPDTRLLHLYLLNDSTAWVVLLFCIAALLALCVIVGYRTRLAALLSWFLLVSVTRRNPFVTHTGDQLLQVLAFWALFLPLGASFSVDRLRGRAGHGPPRSVLSVGTVAALLQVCLFYFMAGVFKHRYEIWTEGEAISVFTHIEQYTRPFGVFLRDYPDLCRVMTYCTLALELGAPLLLLCPWFTAQIRSALFFVLTGFHLGIQLTVYIGIFELLSIVAVGLFLPGWFWERLPRFTPAWCKRAWMRLADPMTRRFARAAPEGSERPSLVARAGGFALQGIAGAAFAFVLFGNYNGARAEPLTLPPGIERYTRTIGLVQRWHIFSDIGEMFFGWFIVPAQQIDGKIVDVLQEREFQGIRRPELFASYFDNHNVRRFWLNASLPKNDWLRQLLTEYLCRRWEERTGVPIYHLAICEVGSVPGKRAVKTQKLNILSRYRAPRPELEHAAPEEIEAAKRLQAEWRSFLSNLPERLPAEPDREAVALAERVLERMGGRAAWEATRHLHWDFMGQREHWWDKRTGDVRIESQDLVVLMNLGTRAGRAFRAGREISGAELAPILEQAYAWWVNDSYWVVMPWKILDPGVQLASQGEGQLSDGRAADVLEMTFAGVGLTARNRYLLFIARDTGWIEEWAYFRDLDDPRPTFRRPWTGYQRFGDVFLATDKGTEHDWRISVHAELPAELYTRPERPPGR